MTELAIPVQREPSSETYRGQAVARLAEWAESAAAANQVAQVLASTSFVPAQFHDKPDEITAAILAGAEVGLTPMAALRSFDIINGAAAPRALTLRAIVQSMGHHVVVDESTATRCIIRARRRDSGEWQKVTWTMDRARQLGLAGKPNWRTQPQTMLVARATGEACRLIAADAILGIGYAAEEISDGITTDATEATETTPTKPAGRVMSLPKRQPTTVETRPPEEAHSAGDEIASEPQPSAITSGQKARMLILFRTIGIEDRDERLHISTAVIGHQVESANKLTKDEAGRLIDTLERVQTAENPREALDDELAGLAEQGVQETFDAEIVEDE